jgi:hypothetical protein
MPVPATAGRESAPVQILQGHLDMVCKREPDSPNDPDEGLLTPIAARSRLPGRMSSGAAAADAWTEEATCKLLDLVGAVPSGPLALSPDFAGTRRDERLARRGHHGGAEAHP